MQLGLVICLVIVKNIRAQYKHPRVRISPDMISFRSLELFCEIFH